MFLHTSERIYQFLQFNEEPREMEAVGDGVVDVQRQRHGAAFALAFVPSPRDDGSQEFPLVEYVHVEAAVAQPREARDVEEVRRLVFDEAAAVFVFFSVFKESRVKFEEVAGIFRDRFRAVFVLLVELGV